MILRKGVHSAAFERLPVPFELDVILPVQVSSGALCRVAPEKRLMIAILEDAILCLRKHRSAKRGPGRRLFQDTRSWVLEPNSDWAFSFQNICDFLDIAVEDVRHCLRMELADD